MGREMAANLFTKTSQASDDAETTFVVHDHLELATKRFLTDHTNLFPGKRLLPASSPAEVASLSSTIITMVPSSPQVKEVYLSESGILQGLKKIGNPSEPSSSTLCIDCTTLDPLVAVQVANEVKQAGSYGSGKQVGAFDMVDAPVSGGG